MSLHDMRIVCPRPYSWREGKAAGAWNWPPPPSAEDKNTWGGYTSGPPHVFMAWCLIKYMDVFAILC